jgi:hypothetical protein
LLAVKGYNRGSPTQRIDTTLVKTNYRFEKRQKELAKKRKQEEKQKRKSAKHEGEAVPNENPPLIDATKK